MNVTCWNCGLPGHDEHPSDHSCLRALAERVLAREAVSSGGCGKLISVDPKRDFGLKKMRCASRDMHDRHSAAEAEALAEERINRSVFPENEWTAPDPKCKHIWSRGRKCHSCDGHEGAPDGTLTLRQKQAKETEGCREDCVGWFGRRGEDDWPSEANWHCDGTGPAHRKEMRVGGLETFGERGARRPLEEARARLRHETEDGRPIESVLAGSCVCAFPPDTPSCPVHVLEIQRGMPTGDKSCHICHGDPKTTQFCSRCRPTVGRRFKDCRPCLDGRCENCEFGDCLHECDLSSFSFVSKSDHTFEFTEEEKKAARYLVGKKDPFILPPLADVVHGIFKKIGLKTKGGE